MKTSKPFTTISYNTIEYLQNRLDDLVARNVLYFYAFIFHYREEDESKDHIHLLMHPNGQVETDKVLKHLEEFDPNNPDKPLRCRPPHKCNSFGDWYLYGLHDTKYLLAHGYQTRKYHYTQGDMITSDTDELVDLIHTIDYKKMYGNQNFFQAMEDGESILDMIKKGIIPMQQYGQYARFFFDLAQGNLNQTFRGEHLGHEDPPKIDPTTGEILLIEERHEDNESK